MWVADVGRWLDASVALRMQREIVLTVLKTMNVLDREGGEEMEAGNFPWWAIHRFAVLVRLGVVECHGHRVLHASLTVRRMTRKDQGRKVVKISGGQTRANKDNR